MADQGISGMRRILRKDPIFMDTAMADLEYSDLLVLYGSPISHCAAVNPDTSRSFQFREARFEGL